MNFSTSSDRGRGTGARVTDSWLERGILTARLLRGAWRPASGAPAIDQLDLAALTPALQWTGSAGLAWWRVRGTDLAATVAGCDLHKAYRSYAAESVLREHDLAQALKALTAAGVTPLLAKGWAVERLYPGSGLRRYDDIDFAVHPHQHSAAQRAVAHDYHGETDIDVALGPWGELAGHSFDDLMARAEEELFQGSRVRVLGREDHLRLLALHALKSGVRRPIWLSDIGVLMDRSGAELDWSRVLSGDPRLTDWTITGLRLAAVLAGASLDGAPPRVREAALPRWVVRSALHQWGEPAGEVAPLLSWPVLRRPAAAREVWRRRWPNPIESTYLRYGEYGARPRLRHQCWCFITGSVRWSLAARLRRLKRR